MENKSRMNDRQKRFADFYIECGNATEAARRAEYKHPKQQGSRLLTNVDILAYIKQRAEPSERKRIASGDDVLEFFTRVMCGKEEGSKIADRILAGKEILKRDIDSRKLEIELLKLESRKAELRQEADIEDTLLEALNAVAAEVWVGDGNGSAAD